MLWPLSWADDNWRSMIHNLGIYCHALTMVKRRWQLMEHVPNINDIYPCSDRCHETMTTDGAWLIPKDVLPCSDHGQKTMTTDWACSIHKWYTSMLWPLSWHDDNGRSMIQTLGIYDHTLSVVMRRWQLTEHVPYMDDILTCSVRCHKMMTTDGAFFIHECEYPCSDRCLETMTMDGAWFIP